MKLPKIQNQKSPASLAVVTAELAGREYRAKLAGLSTESKAKMSYLVNSGKAERQAMVASANLKSAEARSDIAIAQSETDLQRGQARVFQSQTALDQKTLQLGVAEGQAPVAEAKGEVERIKKEAYYQGREFSREQSIRSAEAGVASAEAGVDRASIGILAAGVNVVRTAVDAFVAYDAQQTKEEVNDYKNAMVEAGTTFDKLTFGKEAFAFEDIPEEVTSTLGLQNDGSVVPAYKVMAEWRKFAMTDAMNQLAPNISNEEYRENSIQVQEGAIAKRYGEDVRDGITAGPLYQTQKTLRTVEKFRREGDYGLAIETVRNSQLEIEEKNKLFKSLNNERQNRDVTDIVKQPLIVDDGSGQTTMNQETLVKLEDLEQRLMERDSQTTSDLTEPQYRAALASTRSRIKAYDAYGIKERQAEVSQMYMSAGMRLDTMRKTGKDPNPNQTNQMVKVLQSSPVMTHRKRALDMQVEQFVGPEVQFLNSKTSPVIRASYDSLDSLVEGREGDFSAFSIQEQTSLTALRDTMETNITTLTNSPVTFMRENGLAEAKDFNPQDVVGTVRSWSKMADKIENDHGRSAQFTEDFNYDAMNDYYAGLDVSQRAKFVGQLFAGVDNNQARLKSLVQPMKSLNNPILAMVAERMADGDQVAANAGIRGSMKLQAMPEAVEGAKKEITMQLNAMVGNAYDHNAIEKGAIRDFALAIYADSNSSFGAVNAAENKDLAFKAVERVAGNIIDYNGSKFLPPSKEFDTYEKINAHVESLLPGYLAGMGEDYDEAKVLEWLKDGTAKLEAVNTTDFVINVDGKYIPSKANGNVEYRFTFRKPMMTVADQAHIRATQPNLDPIDGGNHTDIGGGFGFLNPDSGWLQSKAHETQREADTAVEGIRQMGRDSTKSLKQAWDFYTAPLREMSEEGKRKARMAP